MNGSGTDDREQDTHCTIRPEELSHINQDQFDVQRSVSLLRIEYVDLF